MFPAANAEFETARFRYNYQSLITPSSVFDYDMEKREATLQKQTEVLGWGNPNKREEYDCIKTYCPYTNLAAKSYPAMLVKTSFNDSQVMYWEPAKYVAKLRTLSQSIRSAPPI